MDYLELIITIIFPMIILGIPFVLIVGILWRIFKKLK